jgi:hypothetical protein
MILMVNQDVILQSFYVIEFLLITQFFISKWFDWTWSTVFNFKEISYFEPNLIIVSNIKTASLWLNF